MKEIYKKISDYIEDHQMISSRKSVLAAVSGGADSICMLLLLDKYCQDHGISLGVGHVNHGFRREAADEAEYVRSLCEERNIPFFLKEIPKGECLPTEEAARLYRYRLLEMVADENGYENIALAHNANDRAETLLFNMFRGTGLKGMGSIRPVRDRFIRPVLCLKRNEIEAYLKEKNIAFCTDATNLEDNYSRNKIRHNILPISEIINSASIDHMNEAAEYMARLQDYLTAQAERAYDGIAETVENGVSFDISSFIKEDELIRTEMIRLSLIGITPHLKDITAQHVRDIDGLAFRNDNAQIHLPYGIKVYREYDKLVITCNEGRDGKKTGINDGINIDLSGRIKLYPATDKSRNMIMNGADGESYVELADGKKLVFRKYDAADFGSKIAESIPRNKYTKWFDCDKITSVLCVRNRCEGDFIFIDEAGHKKSLSRLFIESKIPERKREEIPVIAAGDSLLWVIGYRDSFAYRVNEDTKTILEIKLEG